MNRSSILKHLFSSGLGIYDFTEIDDDSDELTDVII
jgi:hypothetical protein